MSSPAPVAPLPRWQFFDNSGAPLNGGLVYFYAAGTTTPLAAYYNQDLAAGHAVPVPLVLDSAGRPQVSGAEVNIYFSAANYKVLVQTAAGVTVWTADNVPATSAYGAGALPSTFTVGDLVVANSTSTLTNLPDVAVNQVLASGGVGVAPAYTGTPTVTSLVATTITCPAVTGAPINVCEGRLTGTSGLPVTTGDVTAATSVYFTPYTGNRIALFDGSATWNIRTFTEITIPLAGFTASKPYDIFAYDNSGVVTIETLVWTDATTRATALAFQNGVLVKSGATTRRLLGTIYINSSGGQTDDALLKRNICNLYNQVEKPTAVTDTTDSWNYTTATWRQANASTANQVEVTVTYANVTVDLTVRGQASNDNAGPQFSNAIGYDSTSSPIGSMPLGSAESSAANRRQSLVARIAHMPAAGRHTYTWLEYATAGTGTTTFYGDNGVVYALNGLSGTVTV